MMGNKKQVPDFKHVNAHSQGEIPLNQILHSSFLSIYQFDMILIIGLTIILEHAFSLKNIFKKNYMLNKIKKYF